VSDKPKYEQIDADDFGGDHTAAEIARNNMRRVEGNKLVNPPVRYQQALKDYGLVDKDHMGAQF